jgi:MFS transporter, FHS family, L-fucose permease
MAAFLSLAMVGYFHAILGAALPAIRSFLDIDTARAGLMGSFFWMGFAVAIFAGGALSDHLRRSRILLGACVMIGLAGMLAGRTASFGLNVFFLAVLGAGTGMIVSASSALITDLHPGRAGGMMNVHHFFYSVGAIGGSLAAGFVLKGGGAWQGVYRGGAGAALLLAAAYGGLGPGQRSGGNGFDYGAFLSLFRERTLLTLLLMMLFAAGTQNGIAFWLVSFLKEARGFPIFQASVGLSLFSFGIAGGRLASGWFAGRQGSSRVLLFLLVLLNLALLLFGLLPGIRPGLTFFLCLAAGAGCSGLFPLALTLAGGRFPRLAGAAMGALGTAAGIGSILMPWLISQVAHHTSLGTGFLVNNLSALACLLVIALSFRHLRSSETAR